MHAVIAAALLSTVAPEIELQAGWFHGVSRDFEIDPAAAELAVRAGAVVAGHLTLSARFADILGDEVPDGGGLFSSRQAGVSAWQALGEVRLTSSGPVQVHAAGAAGIARLRTWQVDTIDTNPLHGDTAFAWRVSTGLRVAPRSWGGFGLSLEAAISRWNGLRAADRPGESQQPPDPVTAFSLLGGLVFRFGP